MLKLLKILFVILLIGSLSSCEVVIPSKGVTEEQYTVVAVQKSSISSCVIYALSSGTQYAKLNDEIIIIDSIGKFQVGDSVSVVMIKK